MSTGGIAFFLLRIGRHGQSEEAGDIEARGLIEVTHKLYYYLPLFVQ